MPNASPWQSPPDTPHLSEREAHVWHAALSRPADELDRLRALLVPDERTRADRFRFEKDRTQYTTTRAVLRLLLGQYLGIPPKAVVLEYTARGKPRLPGPDAEDTVHFNVSHSLGIGLVAFARGRQVGVDIEAIRDDVEWIKLAERFFSPREIIELRSLPEADRQRAFFGGWARKEAYLKAHGAGLSVGLNQFTVSMTTPAALLEVAGQPEEASQWCLHGLDVGPAHAAALAVEGADVSVACWQWDGHFIPSA